MSTSIASPPIPIVAELVLVRMALPNPGPKKIREDLGKILSVGLSAGELGKLQQELTTAGLLTKGKRNTFSLTEAGLKEALDFLNLNELPPKVTWSVVIGKYLFPKATGLSASEAAKLTEWEKLAPWFLKRKHKLGAGAGTTVNQVLEAIACNKLGHPGQTTLLGLLQEVLFGLVECDSQLKRAVLVTQLPLFEAGLKKASAEDLRRKLVRDWLAEPAGTSARLPDEPRQAEPFDLNAFALTVKALAADSPAKDRFHDNKVFIAPLWRASQREPNFPHLTLAAFKQRLVEANAHDLLHLSRADMVQAMDPQTVADSETSHLNATFHFVLLEVARS